MANRRVLVVDDDRKAVAMARAYLERDGFEVLSAHSGPAALEIARRDHPALIVLDLMLPGIDGLDICRLLRHEGNVPIIMLTARATEQDKLEGLELGADDYITKPFSPRELVARVRTVLRRVGEMAEATEEDVRLGPLTVSFRRHEALLDGDAVALTPSEFGVLATLVREPGRAFTRQQLLEKALGHNFDALERNVDVHVMNLRRKLRFGADDPIRAVYGVGYKFEMGKQDG